MKILVISNYYPPLEIGGWEQLTRDVAQLLTKRGHQIHVLTSNYRANQITTPEPTVERILHLESPDHIHYHWHYSLMYPRHNRQNRHRLAQTVAHFKPDVIFINSMWNLSHSIAYHAEQFCPGRVVYYVASYWPSGPDAHTKYWQTPTNRAWLRWPKQWLGKLVSRTLLSNTSGGQPDFLHVLCVSKFIQDYMVEEVGVPYGQTKVVNNGIEPSIFKMRNLQDDAQNLKLLYAGRLSEAKGVHTVIEALGEALHSQPELNITLSIIGWGTPVYKAFLQQKVDALNLSNIVQFREQVPREQMPDILADHNALVLPSIWPEPLARMTQEAMACGLVVIGTTTGGTPEILHDGENGLTFEAGNAQMLAEKIIQVARDPALRSRLAYAARITIEQRYTMNHMVEQIENYFQSILNL